MDLAQTLRECESFLRAGQIDQVCRRLSPVNASQVPRGLRLPLANIARRAGMISLGLKILRPVAHLGHGHTSPSSHELAEYGVLLQKRGAVQDALRILSQVNVTQAPDGLLYQAFCHFNRWNYPKAIEILRHYLQLERRSYNHLVGSVNLASALIVVGKFDEALEQIKSNIEFSKAGAYGRLHANSLELRAQARFFQGDFVQARTDLNQAATLLGSSPAHDQFSVGKWLAIVEGIENKDVTPLFRFRALAVGRRHWESVREADRFILQIRFQNELYEKLHFGTPFQYYRERLRAEHAGRQLPDEFILGAPDGNVLRLACGSCANGLVPPRAIHQVLNSLTKDFYKPVGMGGLFSDLFPGEYFDIYSSVNRVYQLIFRTRRWLKDNGLEAELVESGGTYSFSPGANFAVAIPLDRDQVPAQTEAMRLNELRLHIRGTSFSSRDACQSLGISRSSFKLLMAWGLERGIVLKQGSGRSTRYQFPTPAGSALAA